MKIKYGQSSENKVRVAVRGVILKGDEIGIIKVDKYDCFIFPGGGVDEGEDLISALTRELEEEAGYNISVKEHILTTETTERTFTHVNHFYICEIVGTSSVSYTDEEVGLGIHFEWMKLSDLYEYYLNYHDELRFGQENMIVQRSIKSRGFMLLSLLNKKMDLGLEKQWLGKKVDVTIDRPIGYQKGSFNVYPVNYGYIENIFSLDGDEVDCYCLDSESPLKHDNGKVIAVIKRKDDLEDKLVVSNRNYTKEEITKAVHFNEQYFDSKIIMED